MAEIDDKAFNNMQEGTREAPDRLFKEGRLFTESEYNTRASTKERLSYDKGAYDILAELYTEDKAEGKFEDLNFLQFLGTLNNAYLEEKFTHPTKEDPSYYRKAGKLLSDVYGSDPEQLKLSAYNFYASSGDESKRRDRSNISIKAPEAETY
jgi:hypothetical protein|tara:strand:+ start:274 stop:729 length:456 start_codon:yes stop_codon:yes gene_type:complete